MNQKIQLAAKIVKSKRVGIATQNKLVLKNINAKLFAMMDRESATNWREKIIATLTQKVMVVYNALNNLDGAANK